MGDPNKIGDDAEVTKVEQRIHGVRSDVDGVVFLTFNPPPKINLEALRKLDLGIEGSRFSRPTHRKGSATLPPHMDDDTLLSITDFDQTRFNTIDGWINELKELNTEESQLELLTRAIRRARKPRKEEGNDYFFGVLKAAAESTEMSEGGLRALDELIAKKKLEWLK